MQQHPAANLPSRCPRCRQHNKAVAVRRKHQRQLPGHPLRQQLGLGGERRTSVKPDPPAGERGAVLGPRRQHVPLLRQRGGAAAVARERKHLNRERDRGGGRVDEGDRDPPRPAGVSRAPGAGGVNPQPRGRGPSSSSSSSSGLPLSGTFSSLKLSLFYQSIYLSTNLSLNCFSFINLYLSLNSPCLLKLSAVVVGCTRIIKLTPPLPPLTLPLCLSVCLSLCLSLSRRIRKPYR